MTSSEQNTTTVRAQAPAEVSACNNGISLSLLYEVVRNML
jgi:hypothetical protein